MVEMFACQAGKPQLGPWHFQQYGLYFLCLMSPGLGAWNCHPSLGTQDALVTNHS